MAEMKTKKKPELTPRQAEIKRLVDKGEDKRNEHEQARLNQLKAEERRDRFIRLAVKRRNNCIRSINNVARMANKSVYEYTPEEAQRIVASLQVGFDALKQAFSGKKSGGLSDTL